MRPNQQKILLDTDDMLTCSVHAITHVCIDKVHNCSLCLLAVSCELSLALA